MKMYIPCIQKVIFRNNLFIERNLPEEGIIKVSFGEELKPYTELGQTAPQILLSGVWGKVEDIVPRRSVLIKSCAVDLHLVISSSLYTEGELIVFPNPSDLIQKQYLDKFAYSLAGKIIYVGNTVGMDAINQARSYGVAGVLAGGCARTTFDFAQKNNFFLGLFSGFGNCRTPDVIYNVLSDVSTRIVFASEEDHCVRIPMPEGFSGLEVASEEELFKELKRGLKVLVLHTSHFGDTGHVLQVSGVNSEKVSVKLINDSTTIEVNVPNLLAM